MEVGDLIRAGQSNRSDSSGSCRVSNLWPLRLIHSPHVTLMSQISLGWVGLLHCLDRASC